MLRTPRLALSGLLLLANAGMAQAAPACPLPAPRALVETFFSADCEACWQRPTEAGARALRLDWIVPGQQGDDAPLSSAALAEGLERLKSPLAPDATATQRQPLPQAIPGLRLSANSGLAWNGYVALVLELELRKPKSLSPQAAGWVALVERVPAGEDGSPEDRQVVRNVIGPLPLAMAGGRHTLQHLRAVRLPANAQVERLGAVGWIEDGGHVIALTQSLPSGCTAHKP